MEHRFRDQLFGLVDPSRSILLFVVGTAALSLGFQAMYDFANDFLVDYEIAEDQVGGYWLALGFVILAIISVIFSWRRHSDIGKVEIQEEYQPVKRRGLIILAGPTEASSPHAIEYHKGALEFCWIISTTESIHVASELADRFRYYVPSIFWGEPNYIVDPDRIQDTYDLVYRIVEVEAVEKGLNSKDIIADITSGTKPMSTGMGIACLARDIDMEYMKALRDKEGKVIPDSTPEPLRIDTTYIPSFAP